MQLSPLFKGHVVQPNNNVHLVNLTSRRLHLLLIPSQRHFMWPRDGLHLRSRPELGAFPPRRAATFAAALLPVNIAHPIPGPVQPPSHSLWTAEELQREDMGPVVEPAEHQLHRCGMCGESGHKRHHLPKAPLIGH